MGEAIVMILIIAWALGGFDAAEHKFCEMQGKKLVTVNDDGGCGRETRCVKP